MAGVSPELICEPPNWRLADPSSVPMLSKIAIGLIAQILVTQLIQRPLSNVLLKVLNRVHDRSGLAIVSIYIVGISIFHDL